MDAESSAADPHDFVSNRVFQWIKACEATHGSVCNTRNSEHMSQKLETLNFVDVESLSLVTKSPSTKFVALSYVWGSVPMFKTQTSTLDLIRSPGSLSGTDPDIVIPATIRDAIAVTRELGYRYLWVDCLCVVQSSDSIQQALKAMATIYACAELAIVDARGDDADHGLTGFHCSSQNYAAAYEKVMDSDDDSSIRRYGYPFESPWASRGWTFQESLFSRRLLIFDERLSWVCGRCIWLEEEDFPSPIVGEGEVQWPVERPHLGVPVALMLPKHPSLGHWGNLVERYSERALTFEEDSVKAFAGATEILHSSMPGGIFQGLPVFFFDIALLWQPRETVSRRDCSNAYSLPSWSWIGWKGTISCLESWDPFKAGLYRHTDHPSEWTSIVELSPVASWFKISIDGSREVQIHSDFYRFQALRDNVHDDLPPGWSRHEHPAGAYFTNNDHTGFRYSYPLPVPQHSETLCDDDFGRILRCIVPRDFARFGKMRTDEWHRVHVDIVTEAGQAIGCLQLPDFDEISANKIQSHELVSISLGNVQDYERVVEELNPSEWAVKEWEMTFGGSDSFYNVMWIAWDDGIAYRKGLGKVGKEAWDSLQPVVINFKLG